MGRQERQGLGRWVLGRQEKWVLERWVLGRWVLERWVLGRQVLNAQQLPDVPPPHGHEANPCVQTSSHIDDIQQLSRHGDASGEFSAYCSVQ